MELLKKYGVLFLICLIGLLLRLVAWPFAQVVDADAVTRIFIAEKWIDDPHLISEGIWPPLHHYFNAFAIWISGEHLNGPILMHILFAVFTAIPIYYFTKREFGEKGAWLAALVYLLCPVVFRNSFHTLSGIPYAFFMACSMNYLSKSLREASVKYAVLAGFFITIAAGFRYEAWILIAVFTGITVYYRKWKLLGVFWCVAMIFPTFWMIGNYIAHEDIFFGVSGINKWKIESVSLVNKIQRIIFFPFSWFFLFSPFLVALLIYSMVKRWRKKQLLISRMVWSVPFFVMFLLFIYNASKGTLLTQHRFTTTLILFSTPFVPIIFANVKWNSSKKIFTALIFIGLLPLSYVWMKYPYEKMFGSNTSLGMAVRATRILSFRTINAIPELKDQNYVDIKNDIVRNIDESSGLLLDFTTWESSYYLAMNSKLHPNQIFIVDGSYYGGIYLTRVKEIVNEHPNGIIMLKCKSKFEKSYKIKGNILSFNVNGELCIKLTPVMSDGYVALFRYEKTHCSNMEGIEDTPDISFCPDENTSAFYKNQIKDNPLWFSDIVVKAAKNGISIEEALDRDAEWLLMNGNTK